MSLSVWGVLGVLGVPVPGQWWGHLKQSTSSKSESFTTLMGLRS